MASDNRHGIVRGDERTSEVVIEGVVLKLVNLPLIESHAVRGIGGMGPHRDTGGDDQVGAILCGHDRELTSQDRLTVPGFVVIRGRDISGTQGFHRQGQVTIGGLDRIVETVKGDGVGRGDVDPDGLDPVSGGGLKIGRDEEGDPASRAHDRGTAVTAGRLDRDGGTRFAGDK